MRPSMILMHLSPVSSTFDHHCKEANARKHAEEVFNICGTRYSGSDTLGVTEKDSPTSSVMQKSPGSVTFHDLGQEIRKKSGCH